MKYLPIAVFCCMFCFVRNLDANVASNTTYIRTIYKNTHIRKGPGYDYPVFFKIKNTKNYPRKKRLQELSKIEGVWVKGYNSKVRKRIAQLSLETAPTSYPIPYSSSVQDRAVVEIRRGCGRMCRFCQPGHVTLPIRERSGEDIVKIAKTLVNHIRNFQLL